jgi:uncharacterized membrane protein YheB (UPF0754 family)
MMFRPINFFGIWQYKNTGLGIGWQGVVPRKAEKMAKTAFSQARKYMNGPGDWFQRVDAEDMVERIRPHVKAVLSASLTEAGRKHFPEAWELLSPDVKEELVLAALEKTEATAPEFWKTCTDVLATKDIGVDNDSMVITVFLANKPLLNEFFMTVGANEIKFIEHCGAALGFICGVVQLVCYTYLTPYGRTVLLPSTGFFLGIGTNWLALLVCFWPIERHVKKFGSLEINFQGLFMQRQPEVCETYSKLLTNHFFNFDKVMKFMDRKPALWNALKQIYNEHNEKVFRDVLGPVLRRLAPAAMGYNHFEFIMEDVKAIGARHFAEARHLQEYLNRYLAVEMDIERDTAEKMKQMPPDQFENLLHPVFQEDEWILILLGGVLGFVVGVGQVYFLGQ